MEAELRNILGDMPQVAEIARGLTAACGSAFSRRGYLLFCDTAASRIWNARLATKKRARFHFHFTPTSSSWVNQVERLFGIITDRMIRRGTFRSVNELESAIYTWLAARNSSPKPFRGRHGEPPYRKGPPL